MRAELAAWFVALADDLGMDAFEHWHAVMMQLHTVILQKYGSPVRDPQDRSGDGAYKMTGTRLGRVKLACRSRLL